MSFFQKPQHQGVKYFSLAALLLLFGFLDQADGQSGRRPTTPNPKTAPVPATTPSVDPPAGPQFAGLQNKVKLLVARQPTSRKLQSEDAIFTTFVERLNQYANVSATSIGDL